MQKRLYSFGFNAFKQIKESEESIIRSPNYCTHASQVLFTSWETTIVMGDEGALQFLGFQPPWFSRFKTLCQQKKDIKSIFGDPDSMMGLIDKQRCISFVTSTVEHIDCIKHAEQAVYCQSQQSIFVLKHKTGRVERYSIYDLGCESVEFPCRVMKMSAANTQILFLTDSNNTPVYGLGSNRLSQLGMDYQQQELTTPSMIEYFCGLSDAIDIACGPFHSAVILGGDVYTFGWSKDGRLGWGMPEENDDLVSLTLFLDANDQPVEINATKVACGSAHTLVLDDQGRVWSCGSNAYGQLGRALSADQEFDAYFRQCATEAAIDCFTGRWTSFILV
ncbi:regulator of chromosome condensation 1/beta-lactamase-inhibitor protein II [Parasitella parasitica]|nr:regulator of chromosome condensation 1/beta-lactamase-inhibitor protein II [Parasitella parasitica]